MLTIYPVTKGVVILSILNFVVLLNNGSSIQIKSTVFPDQYDAKCSW